MAAGMMSPIKFGRLLAELSLSGRADISARIPAIIEGLKSRLTRLKMHELVLGVAATAYFDQYAQLRKQPREELRSTILSLESDGSHQSAFVRLNAFLEEAGAELPYMPGSGRQKVQFKLDSIDG